MATTTTRALPARHRFPGAVAAPGRQLISPNRHGAWR